jgi:hypothetical protein
MRGEVLNLSPQRFLIFYQQPTASPFDPFYCFSPASTGIFHRVWENDFLLKSCWFVTRDEFFGWLIPNLSGC